MHPVAWTKAHGLLKHAVPMNAVVERRGLVGLRRGHHVRVPHGCTSPPARRAPTSSAPPQSAALGGMKSSM
eukprot:13891044-Alexandrium_andersonii.AAC.1